MTSFISPSRSDVHVDGPLTNISIAFIQDQESFVADKVFSNIPVNKQSDLYFTYDRGEWNRDDFEVRAPGAESAGSNYTTSTDFYRAPVQALHRDVADQVRSNQDVPINLDREATQFITNKGLIKREVTWTQNYFVAANPGVIWTFVADGNATPSAAFDPTDGTGVNNKILFWSDDSSSPIEDVREGKRFIGEETGFRPNIMTAGRAVYDTLLDHPDIVGRLDRGQTPGGPAMTLRENLAALFELEEVLVMDAIQNTAAKGATPVHRYIGGKHALLVYRPPSPGIMTPAAGYTFSWTGFLGASSFGLRILRFRLNRNAADRVEGEMAYDQKKVSADLGYHFTNIVE